MEEVVPPEAAPLIARRTIERQRATRKLRDVLVRAAEGMGSVTRIRTISVIGSYARGAARVGDIDLVVEIDDPREEDRARLDDYYAAVRGGPRPYSQLLRALRCSGSSIANVSLVPRYLGDQPTPVAPEQWHDSLDSRHELAAVPAIGHVVTNERFAGGAVLLFVRGDRSECALARLHAIPEDSSETRFERTTGVPLLDALGNHMTVRAQYQLAAYVRCGAITCAAVVLNAPQKTPRAVVQYENRDPLRRPFPGGRARRPAIGAAIEHLLETGASVRQLYLRGGVPLGRARGGSPVLVDWSDWTLFTLANWLSAEFYRRAFVILRAHCKGPWLALDIRLADEAALRAGSDAALRSAFGVVD